tara:strand:+ start:264 stop:668 length:405 start_codon:yes stop_codon:yes gene_type:complete
MYIEVDKNNYVLGYSDKPSGTSIQTQHSIPSFTDIQKLKSENGIFVVEDSDELRNLALEEPMRLLRQERDRRIAETDWRFRSDLSPSQEWKDYCVALRDLPANYSPTIDILMEDDYPLVKEDNTTPWPEEPTDG